MQVSSARPVVLVLVGALLGLALVAPAVSAQTTAQATPSPCRLLTPREITKQIGEKVGTGVPDDIVPGSCNYVLGGTAPIPIPGLKPFVQTFAVAVLDTAKCGSTKASTGMRPVRVGKKTGIYDTTGVFRAGSISVHTVQLWVKTHGACLNVSWDRRAGPLPSGSAATHARRALIALGRLAIRRM
jgi:hypothetical protein